jgi:3,4-dihydroxy 2-butanone 4-phosphate synthase/GTP cyclohydrolase II
MLYSNLKRGSATDLKPTDIEAAIDAIAAGEILVVTDDADRENEADLIMAAQHCTPEKMAFVIRNTCGIVCVPLSRQTAERLRLEPMVVDNNAPLSTAFTVSVDARLDLTTGISASERCNTVRELANGDATSESFVRPGHVFPLIAREGGVLERTGHTEAAVDLCRLAGLSAVAVICELVNDDGTVMKGVEIEKFAARHSLKRVTIAELVKYRTDRKR